jgi:hypothetical protein
MRKCEKYLLASVIPKLSALGGPATKVQRSRHAAAAALGAVLLPLPLRRRRVLTGPSPLRPCAPQAYGQPLEELEAQGGALRWLVLAQRYQLRELGNAVAQVRRARGAGQGGVAAAGPGLPGLLLPGWRVPAAVLRLLQCADVVYLLLMLMLMLMLGWRAQVAGKNARKWYLQKNPCLKQVTDAEFLQTMLCSVDLS